MDTGKTLKAGKEIWPGHYLFGWTNIKWLVKELVATMSDEPSYFSKKRIQAWILFDTAWSSMVIWFWYHFREMDYMEIIAFATVLFGAAGYQISTIQREKRDIRKLEKKTYDKEVERH